MCEIHKLSRSSFGRLPSVLPYASVPKTDDLQIMTVDADYSMPINEVITPCADASTCALTKVDYWPDGTMLASVRSVPK